MWGLQYTVGKTHGQATDGFTRVYDTMTHKKWVQWRLVILGPSHCTILTGKWDTTPVYVYVGEVAVGNVTEARLQMSLIR